MCTQRLFAVFILVVALSSLSASLTAEYLFDKEPCALCLYQRVPFLITGFFATITLCLMTPSRLTPIIFMFCAFIYFVGSGMAIYHVGIERLWWSSECSGSLSQNTSLEELRASLLQKAEKPCDEVNWSLFGISMATYNVFFSGALGLMSVVASKKMLVELKGRVI